MAPDAFLSSILRVIDEHGWAVVSVGGGGCDCPGCDGGPDDDNEFSYTVGLSTLGFPEVVTYGLPQRTAQASLNRIGDRVVTGRPPRIGTVSEEFFPSARGFLLDADDPCDLIVAQQVYPEVVAAQLVWPDRRGLFPWQTGYDQERCSQPLIGPAPMPRVG